jgi:hypothetical protein
MFWKRSSCYSHRTQSRKWLPGRRRVRQCFCILKVLGDVLDDGELHFVERAQTLEAARRRIEALAEVRPGRYVIYHGETGERVFIDAEAKTFAFGVQIH